MKLGSSEVAASQTPSKEAFTRSIPATSLALKSSAWSWLMSPTFTRRRDSALNVFKSWGMEARLRAVIRYSTSMEYLKQKQSTKYCITMNTYLWRSFKIQTCWKRPQTSRFNQVWSQLETVNNLISPWLSKRSQAVKLNLYQPKSFKNLTFRREGHRLSCKPNETPVCWASRGSIQPPNSWLKSWHRIANSIKGITTRVRSQFIRVLRRAPSKSTPLPKTEALGPNRPVVLAARKSPEIQ